MKKLLIGILIFSALSAFATESFGDLENFKGSVFELQKIVLTQLESKYSNCTSSPSGIWLPDFNRIHFVYFQCQDPSAGLVKVKLKVRATGKFHRYNHDNVTVKKITVSPVGAIEL